VVGGQVLDAGPLVGPVPRQERLGEDDLGVFCANLFALFRRRRSGIGAGRP
jgi:hypothetical protein